MNSIDIDVFNFFNGLAELVPYLNPIAIFLAKYSMYALFAYMILSWLFYKNKEKHRTMLIASVLTFVFAEIIGLIVGRFIEHAQPFATLDSVNQLINQEVGNSFPSTHAMLFFSISFTFYLFSKGWNGGMWVFIAFLVAISRIWIGVSYPSDVLASLIISLVVAFIISAIANNTELISRPIRAYNKFTASLFGKNKKTE